jgi:CspA family cold shock protein
MTFSSSPRGPERGEGSQLTATVKWFNPTKGFGFVAPTDGSPDAFLHQSVLARSGYETVAEGSTVVVEVGEDPKGRRVLRVLEVDESTATPSRPRDRGPGSFLDRQRRRPGGPGSRSGGPGGFRGGRDEY